MLAVTEGAKQLLKDTLTSHSDDPAVVLRLLSNPPGGFGIVLDKETEGDQVVEHEDTKILLVASELAPVLDGIMLDVQETAEGQRLVMVEKDVG